jgi:hypothetical protein
MNPLRSRCHTVFSQAQRWNCKSASRVSLGRAGDAGVFIQYLDLRPWHHRAGGVLDGSGNASERPLPNREKSKNKQKKNGR